MALNCTNKQIKLLTFFYTIDTILPALYSQIQFCIKRIKNRSIFYFIIADYGTTFKHEKETVVLIYFRVVFNVNSDDECLSAPCENGGTCRRRSDTGYQCDCPVPFIGQNCETGILKKGSVTEG